MRIMVLADGETYSEVDGCKILWLPERLDPEEIDYVLKAIKVKKDVAESFGVKHVAEF
jgi:hypothetical protein